MIKDGNKKCSKCKELKKLELFWKSNTKTTPDEFYSSCIECTTKSREVYKEKRNKNTRDWQKANREYANAYRREYDKKRYATNIFYRLKILTKNAILSSIRKNKFTSYSKANFTKTIFMHLPYTAEQLKIHIESLWPWMNWNNLGKYNPSHLTWQIDHIIPQSLLPFSDFNDENFKRLWSLTNLQPLETVANIKKRNKVIY
jgi:hypothetical protein